MADYTAIGDVGRTLLQLLRSAMTPDPIPQPEQIGLASPADKGDFVLTLFLYQITPNDAGWSAGSGMQGNKHQQPPFSMDLHFLLTAHSNADLQSRALDEHRILGRAMQVLHDHPDISGSWLQGSLADHAQGFRIYMREEISLHTAITLFPNQPYKLSFPFVASPVYIDSGRGKVLPRVFERDTRMAPPEGSS